MAGLRDLTGDGIPDYVSGSNVAIGTGADVAIEASGVTLMSGDPRGVPAAIGLSRATMTVVRQNLFWAFAYNIVLIPVAMGVLRGTAFVGLPGNPVAVFVTFARVVRPLLLRLAGAQAEPLTALPVRLAFDYRKKSGRREYVRAALRRAADGTIEAVRHPQEGAGVITSLTETDGLAELSEDSTKIEQGSTVGFLSYATLMG